MSKKISSSSLLVRTTIFIAIMSASVAMGLNNYKFDGRSQASESNSWSDLRFASFENNNFAEWDQTNAVDGTLTIIDDGAEIPKSPIANNQKIAKAFQQGSNSTDGHYSRTIWSLADWTEQTYRTEAYFYLPSGFYSSMEGAVQILGWDTYPVLNHQTRLIIYNGDKKARLFINENNVTREITNSFVIPEGQWIKIAVAQHISETQGWSQVYMNDALVAEGNANSCASPASRCNDTYSGAPLTRIRYGLVAIADRIQTKPLTIYLDQVKLQVGDNSTVTTPTPTPTVSSTPTASPTATSTPSPTPTETVNKTPVISTQSLSGGRLGRSYSATISAYDEDRNDQLNLAVSNLPSGLSVSSCRNSINKRSGNAEVTCSIQGQFESAGQFNILVQVNDQKGASSSKELVIKVK